MRYIKSFLAIGMFFSVLTVSILLLWSRPISATVVTKGAVAQGASQIEVGPAVPLVQPLQGAQAASAGLIYTPRDVVDMTRLVLESSRDHTTHLAHYIEHATTVLVVFFSLLGAVGAALGLHKLKDVDDKAKEAMETFKNGLLTARAEAMKSTNDFQLGVNIANQELRRAIDDQIELVVAKFEMEQAIKNSDMRMLRSAAGRLQAVTANNEVAIKARIRGLADLAYARKRLGEPEHAFTAIVEAAKAAEIHDPEIFPFLAFNAACYACLLGNKKDSLEWLKQAVDRDLEYKQKACKDDDFKTIHEETEFKELCA